MLKNGSRETALIQNDVNKSFYSFLNTFLIISESCFPIIHVTPKTKANCWITTGIRISCKQQKKRLYIHSKNGNCSKFKAYYTQYCTILRKIIRRATEMYYSDLLALSDDKFRTSWNIIKSESGKGNNKIHKPSEFKLGNKNVCINQAAEAFNNYFLNVVEELNIDKAGIKSAIPLRRKWFSGGFPNMIHISITESEIICTIAYLKSKSSCGYNGILNKILKKCGDFISKLLLIFLIPL